LANEPLRRATITLQQIHESDAWMELATALGWTEDDQRHWLEYGDYASVELVVQANGAIVGGRLIPRGPLRPGEPAAPSAAAAELLTQFVHWYARLDLNDSPPGAADVTAFLAEVRP
jgi:hypothetical protein